MSDIVIGGQEVTITQIRIVGSAASVDKTIAIMKTAGIQFTSVLREPSRRDQESVMFRGTGYISG